MVSRLGGGVFLMVGRIFQKLWVDGVDESPGGGIGEDMGY